MPHTIDSLRLNIEEAEKGRTWLLLPPNFRFREAGHTYPLPSRRTDLQRITLIPIPSAGDHEDAGTLYIRRAIRRWKAKKSRAIESTLQDCEARALKYNKTMEQLERQAERVVEHVREEAVLVVANLKDLFELGRQGLHGQMRAHLDGHMWRGEVIKAKDFRDCFRMVAQAVKGLGLPSDQRESATEAVMDQVAQALKDTQETLAMAPGAESDLKN
jgi:hypothetical protein